MPTARNETAIDELRKITRADQRNEILEQMPFTEVPAEEPCTYKPTVDAPWFQPKPDPNASRS